MRVLVVVLAAVALALLVGSRFYPRVERIEVSGNLHHDREAVLELADLAPGTPLLWVNRWRLARLEADPWVERVRVIRHWPDTVSVALVERRPAITDGATSWALDGTVLPDVPTELRDTLIRLEGWGEPRTAEAISLADLLADLKPEVISYTPEGFDIQLAETSLFTPGVEELEAQWAAFISQRGRRVAVYPWGVSKVHD